MKIICNLLGHKFPDRGGWCGHPPYLKLRTITYDGIGHAHGILFAECERCGQEYLAAYVHIRELNDKKGEL